MSRSGGGRFVFDFGELQKLASTDPKVRRILARHCAGTYAEFQEALYDDLSEIVERLEANPQVHAARSEDEITQWIADMLSRHYDSVEHDAKRGGHTDMLVKHLQFVWIAEAKIFTDVSALRAGFEQLATRYSSPPVNGVGLHAGLIAYLKRPDAAGHVRNWRDHVLGLDHLRVQGTRDCSRRGALGFFSDHQDSRYGLPFEVWHLCVSLHFKPQDASARRRAPDPA